MLFSARVPLTASDQEQILKTLDEPIDWEEFVRVVCVHRVAPIVLGGLKLAAPERIPKTVLRTFTRITQANSKRVVQSTLETQRIARALQQQGFQVTVLKGALLSELIYSDPFRRYSVDLDLMTSDQDLDRQILCMSDLGYELVMPSTKLTPRRLRSYSRYRKDFSFKHKRSGVMVDLHWRLFNNVEHKANLLAQSCVPMKGKLFGEGCYMLAPVDQFLYSAAHGVSDAWIYLKSLIDFAAFLRRLTQSELEEAIVRATKLGLLPQISSAIHLAQAWVGAPAVNAPLLLTSDAFHQSMYRQVVDELLKTEFAPNRLDITFATEFRLEQHLVPGLKGTLEIMGRYIFRPRVWSTMDLPDTLFGFYAILGLLVPPRMSRAARSEVYRGIEA
ncbi:nucleotidyltransferase domain-containing protein [Granulicella paludicola]|uniref:nucleotidyltransferase domain-containing protein n=1 Tax=Granulicella paludicola TaxID=474951 RepID=UPI0021E083A9|nr:nucleotidyltransferase family protein [Granulicella paludicola]